MPKNSSTKKTDSGELGHLRAQVEELTVALQRERADSTNLRRQHEEQTNNLRNLVKGNLVREMLPVIDNFERSLKHVPKDLAKNDYINGIQAIVKQFENVLASLGVERIDTKGVVFDPHFHEAVSHEEGNGSQEVVVEELQPGYKIGESVIRHAMVKVKTMDPVN